MGATFYVCHFDRSEAQWRNLLLFIVARLPGVARDVATLGTTNMGSAWVSINMSKT
jgi:hypothetical protein